MINLKIIPDHRFKNIYISVRFLVSLSKERVIPMMLWANMMNESCDKYNTRDKLSKHFDALYGASYSAGCSVLGNALMINVKTKTIHPKYIHNSMNLLEEHFKLLHEFILHPCKENGKLSSSKLKEAKRTLKDHFMRLDDDPSTYSMFEAMKLAAKDQPMAYGISGSIEDIEKVSLEDIYLCYEMMLKESRIDLLVLGEVEENEVRNYVSKYLQFDSHLNTEMRVSYCIDSKNRDELLYGYRNISQTYITSIYQTSISNQDDDFAALRVGNALFGQLPSSLLFQEVREKHSLCYSIYSALYSYDGALALSTGVDEENVEKTMKLIKEQLKKIQNGMFDEDLLTTSKTVLINSVKASNDDPDSILALAYRNILFHKEETTMDVISKIERVSKEDVMRVMSQVELIASYVLGKGDCDEKSC